MMDRRGICAMGVMAKAQPPGRAKTRLCPPLQPVQAAELSAAFLRDIAENIALAAHAAPIHGHVAYAPVGAEACFAGHLAEGTGLVLADGSPPMPPDVQGFGRSLLHAAQAMLASGFGAVCLLNSDSPTLPTALLTRAAGVLLAPGERVVLGPADDGGYYLIGMKQPHAHLVALVVAGPAALDWVAAGLADSSSRVAAFVPSICLAGLLWLLSAAPLVRVPRGPRSGLRSRRGRRSARSRRTTTRPLPMPPQDVRSV